MPGGGPLTPFQPRASQLSAFSWCFLARLTYSQLVISGIYHGGSMPEKQVPQRPAEGVPVEGDSAMKAWKEHRQEGEEEQEPLSQPPPAPEVFPFPEGGIPTQQEVQLPTILDSQGGILAERPDQIIKEYMLRMGLSEDEYSRAMHLLSLRKWIDLRALFVYLQRKKEGDDNIRLSKAIETIDNMQGGAHNG